MATSNVVMSRFRVATRTWIVSSVPQGRAQRLAELHADAEWPWQRPAGYRPSMSDERICRGVCFLLALAAPLGCGGDGSDSIPIADLPARTEHVFCAYEVRCGHYADEESCKTAFFEKLQGIASVMSGKAKYDGKAAAACLAAFDSAECKISTAMDSPQSCRDAVKGTVADGGDCLDDDECVSTRCDVGSCAAGTCCPGVCVALSPLGASCGGSSASSCVSGAVCKFDSATSTESCVARVGAGQPCTAFDSCSRGTFCLGDGTTAGSTCLVPPSTGQPCPGGVCDDSHDVCDTAARVCTPRVHVGGSCATAGCVSYASCDATTKICIARGLVGGVCTDTAPCLLGLSCQNGTCVAPADVPACS
jgi:hypothetical protein